MPDWFRKRLGSQGERIAEKHLAAQGMRIVARNVRSRFGELDLVALDGRQVVFVEVKTRSEQQAGHPFEAVGTAKQRKLTTLALQFLKKHGLLEHPARFDVVAVSWTAGEPEPKIEHVRNAFEPDRRFQMFG